jgi:feruloyl-CoA synthase
VADAAVIGRDDREWQQAVVAAVVVRKGAEVSVEALRAFCGKRLAGFKVPKEITFVSELPRDAQGKLRRALLRR